MGPRGAGELDHFGNAGPLTTTPHSDANINVNYLPVTLTGAKPYTAFAHASNAASLCGWNASGSAECWGDNSFGELGSAGFGGPVPAPISGMLTFTAIGMGSEHACGLTSGKDVYCWGEDGYGQFGNGTVNAGTATQLGVYQPTPVLGLPGTSHPPTQVTAASHR